MFAESPPQNWRAQVAHQFELNGRFMHAYVPLDPADIRHNFKLGYDFT